MRRRTQFHPLLVDFSHEYKINCSFLRSDHCQKSPLFSAPTRSRALTQLPGFCAPTAFGFHVPAMLSAGKKRDGRPRQFWRLQGRPQSGSGASRPLTRQRLWTWWLCYRETFLLLRKWVLQQPSRIGPFGKEKSAKQDKSPNIQINKQNTLTKPQHRSMSTKPLLLPALTLYHLCQLLEGGSEALLVIRKSDSNKPSSLNTPCSFNSFGLWSCNNAGFTCGFLTTHTTFRAAQKGICDASLGVSKKKKKKHALISGLYFGLSNSSANVA